MKTLFKPSLLKIVIASALFIVLSLLYQIALGFVLMDAPYYGIPFQFFISWGPCQAGKNCSEFNGLWLVLDILFWYVISAFILGKTVRRNKK